jgi:hypothetical protein
MQIAVMSASTTLSGKILSTYCTYPIAFSKHQFSTPSMFSNGYLK